MNINSVCLSIQTEVLNNNPLLNEPGDNRPKAEYEKYKIIVEQKHYFIQFMGYLKSHPLFKDVMIEYFFGNFKSYYDRVKKLIETMKAYLRNMVKKIR